MTQAAKKGPALSNHKNSMPTLIPVPIETKGQGFFKALWIWLKSTREWRFESDWDFYLPGIIHDFAYRYDYVWIRKPDGGVEKFNERIGRKYWDELFLTVGNHVNGVFIINFLAWFALTLGGWMAWNSNREKQSSELTPDAIILSSDLAEPSEID